MPLLSFAIWWYAGETAFARKMVTTTVMIEELHHGPAIERWARATSYPVNAAVHYLVEGVDVHTARVGICPGPNCSLRRPGQMITIGYDPQNPAQAVLASGGGSPPLPFRLLVFGLVGATLIVVASVNAIGRWRAWHNY